MRYVYQQIQTRPAVTTAVVESIPRTDSGVDVYVNAATYDAILAVLSQTGDVVPAEIASVFEHRGSFIVFCDAGLA